MLWLCVLVSFPLVGAQLDAFALPQAPRYAPKPTVPPEYSSFFELDGHARELVDSLLGPRPGGLFPVHVPSTLERTLEQFFTAPENSGGHALPLGFGSGFSLLNNNKGLTSVPGETRRAPEKTTKEDSLIEGSGEIVKSSIGGIPKVFPKLPKAPISQPQAFQSKPTVVQETPILPKIQSAPEVPEGGFLPSEIRRAPQHVTGVSSSVDETIEGVSEDEYGGLSEETATSSGGLIGTILNLIGLGQRRVAEAKSGMGKKPTPEEKNAFGKAVSNLIGGENSPLPGKDVISKVLYNTLTSGSIQNNETLPLENKEKNTTIVLTPAQSAAITENLEMVQNFISQPSSPLCTSKPEPVEFDLYAFMGQWYQGRQW